MEPSKQHDTQRRQGESNNHIGWIRTTFLWPCYCHGLKNFSEHVDAAVKIEKATINCVVARDDRGDMLKAWARIIDILLIPLWYVVCLPVYLLKCEIKSDFNK